MPNVCPECHKDDAIQKVTSITAAGEASGTFSGPSVGLTRVDGKWGTTGGYTTLSGSTMTELARKLTPPKEPRPPSFMWSRILPLCLITGVPTCACVGAGVLGSLLAPLESGGEPSVVWGLFGAVAGGGSAIALVLAALPAEKKKDAVKQAEYQKEKSAWDAAIQRYRRLYYCFRDDIVFDPETGATCDPSGVKEYLYSNS